LVFVILDVLFEVICSFTTQEKEYLKRGPYYTIEFIGVDIDSMANGAGNTLLDLILKMAKEEKKNLFLASMSPRLTAWYLKKGFKTIHTFELNMTDKNGVVQKVYSNFMGIENKQCLL